MPIIIPTIDEINRMNARQLAVIRKRLPSLRKAIEDSMQALGDVKVVDIDAWAINVNARFQDKYRSMDIEQARIIHKDMGPDIDADENMRQLEEFVA